MINDTYISVKDAAEKFNISERRVQKLCETSRIVGAEMISGVWVIPSNAIKPSDERMTVVSDISSYITLNELCEELSISTATGRNWVKLGKLLPDHLEKRMPVFTREYTTKIKNDIQTGKNKALKSRRNKKFISGNALYNSYVTEHCKGIHEVQRTLEKIDSSGITLSTEVMRMILAEAALHIFTDRLNIKHYSDESFLLDFVSEKLSVGGYDRLILDLIENKDYAYNFCREYYEVLDCSYSYEDGEDVLGLLYISCKNMSNRKATGSYYTPTYVVKKLMNQISVEQDTRIMDPCCGTGNFLMQLPSSHLFENIYGTDIDDISVKITRINMALKFLDANVETIYSHIVDRDYLVDGAVPDMDYIIGNPPWGYEYSDDEKMYLKDKYECAKGKNIESYDVFTEQAINHLKKNGSVLFVLPEAFLNVKAHTPIRKRVMSSNSLSYLEYLGNAFDGVQCPCIILGIKSTGQNLSTIGMRVNDGEREFVINTERDVTPDYFSFSINDEEYSIIQKILKHSDVVYLKDNADFALGIVTGNNKEYISNEKTDENEMVLKGSDICKYRTKNSDNYIVFKPDSFQQVAPTSMYRAKEKLLYRFICSQLVFAYDNKQTLSLNSCNIMIPRIEGIDIKYVMAILNSRVAQFVFSKVFNSVKILRSHIETIPIPRLSTSEQEDIITMVNSLIDAEDNSEVEMLYNELDRKICVLFGLNESEIDMIIRETDGGNKFLE